MPLTCEEARFEDGPAIANAYISAFFGDPFHDTQIQGVPFDRQVAGVLQRFPRNFVNPSSYYRKVVDTDSGAVVSYAKWGLENVQDGSIMFPQDREVPEEFQQATKAPPSDPEGLNDEFVEWFSEQVDSARKEALGDRPLLKLNMLGTVPSAQGRGAGTLQVKWGIEFADKHGLPCWAAASPNSIRILKKFGFKPTKEIVCKIDEKCGGGTYLYTSLVREPQRLN